MPNTPKPRPDSRNAVVFCSDVAGLPITLFAVQSVLQLSPNRNFDILICSLDPLELPDFITDLGVRNHTMQLVDRKKLDTLRTSHLPLTTYLRLWLCPQFSDTYDRILYLDYDTRVVATSIDRLFEIDLGPHAIAGTLDKMQLHNPDNAVHDFRTNGIACNRYLNTGVLLLDTAQWNAQDLTRRILTTSDFTAPPRYHDQSLINLYLRGTYAQISPVWNWQLCARFPLLTKHFKPKILHFCGPDKPWLLGSTPNMMPRELITAYHAFFAEHNLPTQFDIHPKSMHFPFSKRPKKTYKQLMAAQRMSRIMSRFPDPYTALI